MAQLDLEQNGRWDLKADCCTEKTATLFRGGTLGDCNSHCPRLKSSSTNQDSTDLELSIEIFNYSGSDAYIDLELNVPSNIDVSPADYTNEPIDDGDSKTYTFTISDDGGQSGSHSQLDVDAEYAHSSAAYNVGNMSSVKVKNGPVMTH